MEGVNFKNTNNLLEVILKNIESIILIINGNKEIIEVNNAFLKTFQVEKKDVLSKKYIDILKCEDINLERCNTCNICNFTQKNRDISIFEKGMNIVKNYREKHFMLNSQEIDYNNENMTLIVLNEVTELVEKNLKLEKLSTTDELTGLYNRRFIMDRLKNEIKISNRHRQPLSIIIIDIDKFKEINDYNGHYIGDKVLKATSKIMKDSLRETDYVGRIGGEEFIIILPNTDLYNAYVCADRIRKNIYKDKMEFYDDHVTISGGLTMYKEGEELEDLFQRADSFLYEAKRKGRNRIVY